jgi:hypothetical protein
MTYATKFHGFDLGGITIPDGFEDESYQNDACPSFYHHATGLRIWVDWLNPAERDTPRFPRFTLQQDREPIGEEILATTEIYNGDDWSEVTRRATIRVLIQDAIPTDYENDWGSDRQIAADCAAYDALTEMGITDAFFDARGKHTCEEIAADTLAWVTEQESE